jgi:outer membrane receptor protein involved in Fe transport
MIYLTDDIKLIAETYFKKLEDVVVRKDHSDMKFSNTGKGWASGIDLSLVKRLSNNFYGQLSYSYTQSKRNDNNGNGEYDYEFSKPHMFNIMGGVQLSDEWSLSAKWYITSGYPADDYIIHSNVLDNTDKMRYSKEITKKAGSRLAANHSLNIRVDYRTQFKYFALTLYADVLNSYGYENITAEEFLPQSGESSREALEAIPTIGFSLEF